MCTALTSRVQFFIVEQMGFLLKFVIWFFVFLLQIDIHTFMIDDRREMGYWWLIYGEFSVIGVSRQLKTLSIDTGGSDDFVDVGGSVANPPAWRLRQ
jgi:hypothetical protein